jgi:hypothetical protein
MGYARQSFQSAFNRYLLQNPLLKLPILPLSHKQFMTSYLQMAGHLKQSYQFQPQNE